jgi:hydrogenase expression/formation protein HypE
MEKILLGHGSGGRLMHQLIRDYFAPAFGIEEFNDSAIIDVSQGVRIAITTDSYVVSPLFFPGGNIGSIAVNGTVNDLSVSGAIPLYLSAGFIIEEGLSLKDLEMVLFSMKKAAENAGIKIVTGDTKVVNKGKGDGIFINTTGFGIVPSDVMLSPKNIKPNDRVIVSGSIGNHGIAVMSERNGLSFDPPIISDSAPLNKLVHRLFESLRKEGIPLSSIRIMRDPTRGGIATSLKEIAEESGLCIQIKEDLLPIESGVIGACELLGLDPLYVANEGILLAVVSPDISDFVLDTMRKDEVGKNATIIGEVNVDNRKGGMLFLKTKIGGTRIVEMLSGEQLPRIC